MCRNFVGAMLISLFLKSQRKMVKKRNVKESMRSLTTTTRCEKCFKQIKFAFVCHFYKCRLVLVVFCTKSAKTFKTLNWMASSSSFHLNKVMKNYDETSPLAKTRHTRKKGSEQKEKKSLWVSEKERKNERNEKKHEGDKAKMFHLTCELLIIFHYFLALETWSLLRRKTFFFSLLLRFDFLFILVAGVHFFLL